MRLSISNKRRANKNGRPNRPRLLRKFMRSEPEWMNPTPEIKELCKFIKELPDLLARKFEEDRVAYFKMMSSMFGPLDVQGEDRKRTWRPVVPVAVQADELCNEVEAWLEAREGRG